MTARRPYSTRRPALLAFLLLTGGACADGGSRRAEAGRVPTKRLDGGWDLSLRLERAMSLSSTPVALPFTVRGVITMMTNDRPALSFASISAPTQIGVYALPLDSLGLLPWDRGEVPTLAARDIGRTSFPAATGDSVLIVLNPGMPGRTLRLAGVYVDGRIRGEWIAESPLGGGGTFEMRRTPVAKPGST